MKKEHNHDEQSTDFIENEQEELLGQLHQCGRFIYHRVVGARGQGSILKILAEHPQTTQKELLTLLNVQPGSLSELLTKLERKGFITRTKDDEDKRKVCVSVTDMGRRAGKDHIGDVKKHDLFNALDAEERQELLRLLKKVNGDWEQRYGKSRGDRCHGRDHDEKERNGDE